MLYLFYNSSAVAEMGDRLATTDMAEKWGAAVPLSVEGAESPSNTMWLGRGLHDKWHPDSSDRLATIHQR